MEINTQINDKTARVTLQGELDASNAVLIDNELQRLIRKDLQHIWINGTGISYISSAGLGVFLSHLNSLQQRKINLLFFGLNNKVKNIFTILGLEEIIPIVEDEHAAQHYSEQLCA